MQLPTEKAHEFHDEVPGGVEKKEAPSTYEIDSSGGVDRDREGVRLHPKVVQKLRSIVACGETRVYAIRKQLR